MGRGSEQTFFQRRHTGAQKVHEKVLNTDNHGNAYQNHNEISPVRMTITKKTKNKQVLVRMWRKENPCAQWVGM